MLASIRARAIAGLAPARSKTAQATLQLALRAGGDQATESALAPVRDHVGEPGDDPFVLLDGGACFAEILLGLPSTRIRVVQDQRARPLGPGRREQRAHGTAL